MRKSIISLILVAAFAITGVTAFADVDSSEQAYNIVKQQLLTDNDTNLPVYATKSVLPAGTTIETFKKPILTTSEASWMVFIDKHPGANWEHACQYVFIDPVTESVKIIDAVRPPEMLKDMVLFQGHDILGGKNIIPKVKKNVNSSRSVNNLWAVILSGGASSGSNHVRYWNDCSNIYNTLVNVYGYLDDHIIVAISDGTDPTPDQSNGGNSDPDLDGDGDDDIMYSCVTSNLTTIFGNLATTLGSQDSLFIFTTDHGSGQSGTPNQPTSMNLWNSEEIWDYDFADLLEPIQCREMILTLEPCFSGGFVNDIIDMSSTVPRIISTAANDHEYSWAMPPDYVYDTYVFHWTAAVSGEDAFGVAVDADANSDGEITMDEAYQYALDADTDDEHPQYAEWPAGYGATVTLAGSGASSEGVITLDSDAYNCSDLITIVVEDLDLAGSGTLVVTVESTTESTPEPVTLTETDESHFEGAITTATGAPSADGILQVTAGDTITGVYEDANYGGTGALTLTATAGVDCTSPVISDVTVSDISDSGFVVSWTTDEPADSVIMYGETTGLGLFVEDTELVTAHSLAVTSLTDCTMYYFEIHSSDSAGNEAIDNYSGSYYSVLTLELVVMLNANMDVDPGWTYEGQWAWGVPQGSGGDPTSGYTGSNVVGYNLAGTYPNNLAQMHCTTQSFDCSEATQVYLSFWKWLGVESSSYDHASISVSGNNGTSWTQIWDHSGGSVAASSWSFEEYDISSIAASQSQVLLRWTMGTTDSSVVYCGWNIDDVLVSFTQECSTAPTPTPTPGCNNDGDVNQDYNISSEDAQLTFMIALGSYSPSWVEECSADCDGSGAVTAGDAQLVFLTALGSGSCADPIE